MTKPKRPSRPRDLNQLAKLMIDLAGEGGGDIPTTDDGKDLAAVLLGRRGGLKGGVARRDALSQERRSEIASKAAQARWGNHGKKTD